MVLPLREAVRAVLTDGGGRLLLVRFGFPDGPVWATPGGGIERGESHEEAIRRELHEEVGVQDADAEVGPAIWSRTHVFPLSAEFGGQHETFYLVRVQEVTGSPAFSDEELRAEGLTGSRWWTRQELRDSTNERFAPKNLPRLFESLLLDGPPTDLVETGE